MALPVGAQAPDFELEAVTGENKHKLKLSDYRGKYVVLSFHPLDFTPVCSTQQASFGANLNQFKELNAQIIGISTDSVYSHIGWQQHAIGMLDYPLCADFYPKGDVASQYGIMRSGPPIPGINERAVFIIDPEGKIAWNKIYDLGQKPDHEEVLGELKKLQSVKA